MVPMSWEVQRETIEVFMRCRYEQGLLHSLVLIIHLWPFWSPAMRATQMLFPKISAQPKPREELPPLPPAALRGSPEEPILVSTPFRSPNTGFVLTNLAQQPTCLFRLGPFHGYCLVCY